MATPQTIEELQPNTQLGHYTILEHLADGGMGHVYRAFEPSLNREVAIKVLKMDLAKSSKHVDFFEGEAQKIAALRHPNIVPIYYIGKQGTLRYFVMAFVAGGATLDNWIDTNTPLTIEQSFWVMGQAIDALSAALQHQIIHLDIKPSNFLVDAKGESILLTDFGLARSLSDQDDLSQERDSFGTPAYMCPEQILNNPVDQRSDIYSLGASMYHLMTTKMLFERETIEEIIVAHCESPFPYKEAEAAGLSAGWMNLFDRMTQKDPNDRFQTYEELRDALAHVDQLSPISARQAEPEEELIVVPNRSNETKEYLYGLLSKNCSQWAEGKADQTVSRSKAEILEQINKPVKPLQITEFTKALLELQESVAPDIDDLVEALEMMPEMKNFIIALANASMFKPDGPVSASKGAVQIIGLELAHHLILTDVILRKTPPASKEFNWWPLIQHSISVGVVASKLVDYFDRPAADTGRISQMAGKLMHLVQAKTSRLSYLAGFMHDIGKFVLGEVAPYPLFIAMRRSMEEKKPLHLLEANIIGTDHHDIAEIWCSKFNFDSVIKDIVAHHHLGDIKASSLRSVVFIANQLVKRSGLGFSGSSVVEIRDVCKTVAWEQLKGSLNITPEQFQEEFVIDVNQLPLLESLQSAPEKTPEKKA